MNILVIFSIGLGLALSQSEYHRGTTDSSATPSQFDPATYRCDNVIIRDVVVIGGGASGTYGAIKLKDMGRSVVVVEKKPEFGGHVETYTDPTTGTAVDYGVQAYINDTITTDFFARFGVGVARAGFSSQTVFADFRTGQVLSNFSLNFQLGPYAAQLNKYPDFSQGMDVPIPVPQDLLLSFRDFIKKYSLQDIAFTIASLINGNGNILDELMVFIFSSFNNVVLGEIAGGTGISTKNNSELFLKAQAELGPSALVNSVVVAGHRPTSDTGVRLVVRTPTGLKLIIASQILTSAPIVLDNMTPFGLDSREYDLFKQIYATAYYICLVGNTGLQSGFTYTNAGANTSYHIPQVPGAYRISSTRVPGLFYVWYGAQDPVPEDKVKADVIAAIQRLSQSDVVPQILAYASHTPFKQQVSAEAVASGFFDKLNALQGYRNTWYTGNAFDSSGTSSLWNFTARLLPHIDSAVANQQGGRPSASSRC